MSEIRPGTTYLPKLIMIRGNSGSGKTSVARALQRELGSNTLVISQDAVRREMLWVKDGEGTKALPLLITLLEYGHDNCEVTILEGILNSSWYRPLFEREIQLFGDKIFAYYYDLPFEETLRRHETRDIRHEFGEEDMRRWWNEKDYLNDIKETVFTEEISLDGAVNRILSDIKN